MNVNYLTKTVFNLKPYRVVNRSSCCKPRPPSSGGCPPQMKGGKINQPPDCIPGPIPPNPCVPRFHQGKDTWKKYKYIALFGGIPLILIQTYNCFAGHKHEEMPPCRDYEYMRRRVKRFPWGDGQKTFFHNDRVNRLPGECDEGPFDCDE